MNSLSAPVAQLRGPAAKRDSAKRFTYIYLTSVEHSGSTLISCLYDAHPEVTSIGEFGVNHSAQLKCPCGTTVDKCDLWNEWKQRANEVGYEFIPGDLGINLLPQRTDGILQNLYLHQFPSRWIDTLMGLALSGTAARKNAERAIEKSIQLARILCEINSTRVFVDTSKNPLQIRHLARRHDIDFKMIGLVRDGRAVMKSVIEKENYSTEQAIGSWKWGVKHMQRAMQYVPAPDRLILRLEDLCLDPEKTIKELFRFAEVDPCAEPDFSLERRHLTGNRMRHKFDGKIRPHDESWKTWLKPEQIERFNKQAGAINRNLGYAL